MKKFLALMLAMLMALSLVACGGGNNAADDNNDKQRRRRRHDQAGAGHQRGLRTL